MKILIDLNIKDFSYIFNNLPLSKRLKLLDILMIKKYLV